MAKVDLDLEEQNVEPPISPYFQIFKPLQNAFILASSNAVLCLQVKNLTFGTSRIWKENESTTYDFLDKSKLNSKLKS